MMMYSHGLKAGAGPVLINHWITIQQQVKFICACMCVYARMKDKGCTVDWEIAYMNEARRN
eukprot:m.119006 g.119006  ORF g.119006 m.119006 type:complete len:61 (-) comp12903_c2_seq2:3102-3284(-)